MVDGTDVIAATNAKNGIVYVLDKMLESSGRRSRSIVDEMRKRPELSTFFTLMQRSDLGKMLADGMITVNWIIYNYNSLWHQNRDLILFWYPTTMPSIKWTSKK